MKFSSEQRLILMNQYEILRKIDDSDAEHYEQAIEILRNGYEIFYSELAWIDEPMSAEDSMLVLRILDVYRAIEDFKRVNEVAEVLMHPCGYFRGFDGNNESEYLAFARFLLLKQNKFTEQLPYLKRNDGMNSHLPMLDKYRRMIDEFGKLGSRWDLTKDDVVRVLDA